MYYPLTLLEAAGVNEIVFNTHHLPQQIAELVGRIPKSRFATTLSSESAAPLGSGGGVWQARDFLKGGGDFLVCNGDEVILPRQARIMENFVSAHRKSGALATILVMEHPLVGSQFGGVWTDALFCVRGFGKDPKKFAAHLKGYHYIGLLLLSDRVFEYLPEGESNILYDALTLAIADGQKINALVGDFTWFETGNAKDFLHATKAALDLLKSGTGEDARSLQRICNSFWSESTKLVIDQKKLLLRGTNTQVDARADLSGFIVMGDGSQIGAACKVSNSVLLPNAVASGAIHEQILF